MRGRRHVAAAGPVHAVGGAVRAADAAVPPWRRLGGGRQVRRRRRAPHADRRERVRCRERELSPYPVGEVPGAGPRREGCGAVAACECGRVRAGPGPHRDRRRLRRRPPRLPDRADGRRRAARGQCRRPPRRLQCGERGRRLLPTSDFLLSGGRNTLETQISRLRRPQRCSGSTGSTTTPNLRDRPARATASTPAHRRT